MILTLENALQTFEAFMWGPAFIMLLVAVAVLGDIQRIDRVGALLCEAREGSGTLRSDDDLQQLSRVAHSITPRKIRQVRGIRLKIDNVKPAV